MTEEILKLRAEGYGYKLIAKKLGIKNDHVRYICNKNGVGGFIIKPVKKTDDEVTAFIKERLPDFEYVGNYKGCEDDVDIKCTICGTVMTRSMRTVRKGNVKCRVCEKAEKEQRELEKIKQQKLLADERKRQRFWSRQFKQIEMKQCPTCREFFIGNRTYCSNKCQQQNHWHMKDGYRNLFPLEEVYERDGGVCYLCGQPCDWDDFIVKDGVIVYGNNYPSRDHVVPKSQGGKNEWQNIRLAHRGCNSRKGIAPILKK